MTGNAVLLIPFAVYGICVLAYQVGCLLNKPAERPKIEPSDGKRHLRPWYHGDFNTYLDTYECKKCNTIARQHDIKEGMYDDHCKRCGLLGVEYAGYRKWNGVEWKLPEKKGEVKE